MTGVVVRAAGTADVEDVAGLEALAFPLDPWSPVLIAQAADGTVPTVGVLVAERDGLFAGYAVVSVVDVDAELQRIAVPEDLRRGGIAGTLLDAVHVHAASHGAERLLLEVREDNLTARIFYERAGFAELGRRPRYYRDGATALVLAAQVRMVP